MCVSVCARTQEVKDREEGVGRGDSWGLNKSRERGITRGGKEVTKTCFKNLWSISEGSD